MNTKQLLNDWRSFLNEVSRVIMDPSPERQHELTKLKTIDKTQKTLGMDDEQYIEFVLEDLAKNVGSMTFIRFENKYKGVAVPPFSISPYVTYRTPHGVYGYPLNEQELVNLASTGQPTVANFATDYSHFHIYKITDTNKIVYPKDVEYSEIFSRYNNSRNVLIDIKECVRTSILLLPTSKKPAEELVKPEVINKLKAYFSRMKSKIQLEEQGLLVNIFEKFGDDLYYGTNKKNILTDFIDTISDLLHASVTAKLSGDSSFANSKEKALLNFRILKRVIEALATSLATIHSVERGKYYSLLLHAVDIDAIDDKGMGIIHPNEPSQSHANDFSGNNIESIGTYDNIFNRINSENNLYEKLFDIIHDQSKSIPWSSQTYYEYFGGAVAKMPWEYDVSDLEIIMSSVDFNDEDVIQDFVDEDEGVIHYITLIEDKVKAKELLNYIKSNSDIEIIKRTVQKGLMQLKEESYKTTTSQKDISGIVKSQSVSLLYDQLARKDFETVKPIIEKELIVFLSKKINSTTIQRKTKHYIRELFRILLDKKHIKTFNTELIGLIVELLISFCIDDTEKPDLQKSLELSSLFNTIDRQDYETAKVIFNCVSEIAANKILNNEKVFNDLLKIGDVLSNIDLFKQHVLDSYKDKITSLFINNELDIENIDFANFDPFGNSFADHTMKLLDDHTRLATEDDYNNAMLLFNKETLLFVLGKERFDNLLVKIKKKNDNLYRRIQYIHILKSLKTISSEKELIDLCKTHSDVIGTVGYVILNNEHSTSNVEEFVLSLCSKNKKDLEILRHNAKYDAALKQKIDKKYSELFEYKLIRNYIKMILS